MGHSPLLLQLVIILGAARVLAMLLRYLGQPPVVGEMVAGLLLGPIVFGAIAPETHALVFAKASLVPLEGLSQIGLVLFMFIVGAELRLPLGLRPQLIAASWVGILSVLLPMTLGLAIAPMLYPQLAPEGVQFWPFALFMAASMSITAFPVMARILKERRLTRTPIGSLSLTSAAIADVVAWIMLAIVVVLANAHSDWSKLAEMIGGLIVLSLIVFAALRPLYAWLIARYAPDGQPGAAVLSAMLIGMFACAYTTSHLNVHPVFGAFLFGACLPRDNRLLACLIERIEYVALLVLMPIFFALAGLNTTPDVFVGADSIALVLILAAAIVGKMLGGGVGARIAGHRWRDSFAVGSLMNARGLMELIVMKVGLDAGIIGRPLFTMLLVMAILTTVMTGPMLTLILGSSANAGRAEHADGMAAAGGKT
jgi:Kef-type K+ transport system membrane component KefB